MQFDRPLLLILLLTLTFSCSNDLLPSEENTSTDNEIEEDNNNNNKTEEEALYFPPIGLEEWLLTSPEALNWNTNQLEPLSQLLSDRNTDAFIVLKNGKIALEWYFGEFNKDTKHTWNSAGKTITALMIGIAQEEGSLKLEDPTSQFLGEGWTSLTPSQESQITIKNQLTMTSGLDYSGDIFCYDPDCLTYLNDPNTFWYYHNAPYTLLDQVITEATQTDFKEYYKMKIGDKIGMVGQWVKVGYNNLFFSNTRSMARFGLLILNEGKWKESTVIKDMDYFNEMTNSSQEINPAYGYLWWLNGKDRFRLPNSDSEYTGKLIESAPDDLIAGLGANDQKLYVVPSQNLVVVRFGADASSNSLSLSSFDEDLWSQLNKLFSD